MDADIVTMLYTKLVNNDQTNPSQLKNYQKHLYNFVKYT